MGTSKLSDSIQDLTGHMDNLFDSMKDMGQYSFEEQVKNYDKFINEMVKAQDEYNEALEKSNKLTEEIADKRKKTDEADDKYTEEVNKKYAEVEALEKKLQAIKNLNESVEAYNKKAIEWANKNEVITKALEEQRKVVQDLQKEYDESAEGVKDYDKVLNDLIERVHDLGRSFDDLNFDSKLAKGLGNELKNINFDNFKDGVYKLDYVGNTFNDVANKIIDNIKGNFQA